MVVDLFHWSKILTPSCLSNSVNGFCCIVLDLLLDKLEPIYEQIGS